jgi:DNA-directed RNA polymerase subunit E'/Rpb7
MEAMEERKPGSAELDAVFEEKISLPPSVLKGDITSFDDILLEKLREKLEGKCSRHGFVIPKSLELLSRSLGIAEKGRFTGEFIYFLKAQGKVYNPPDGFEAEGQVFLKNKMGLLVVLYDAIRVMIPRDLHIGDENFDSVEKGDRVRFIIRQSKFQVNDKYILSIGQFVEKIGGEMLPAPAEAENENEEAAFFKAAAEAEAASGGGALEEEEEEVNENEEAAFMKAAALVGNGAAENEEGGEEEEEE